MSTLLFRPPNHLRTRRCLLLLAFTLFVVDLLAGRIGVGVQKGGALMPRLLTGADAQDFLGRPLESSGTTEGAEDETVKHREGESRQIVEEEEETQGHEEDWDGLADALNGESYPCRDFIPPHDAFREQLEKDKVYLQPATIDKENRLFLDNGFTKYLSVFGIRVVGTEGTPDSALSHIGGVLASYLDNDQDGAIDNQQVVDSMRESNALMVVFKDGEESQQFHYRGASIEWRTAALCHYTLAEMWVEGFVNYRYYQHKSDESGDQECRLARGTLEAEKGVRESAKDSLIQADFDWTLLQVLELVSYAGIGPSLWNVKTLPIMLLHMDRARGGHFVKLQDLPLNAAGVFTYPSRAVYTSYDVFCEYESCMANRFFTYALITLMGAWSNDRCVCEYVQSEWKLCSAQELVQYDSQLYSFLTEELPRLGMMVNSETETASEGEDSPMPTNYSATHKEFVIPTRLPNGRYDSPALVQATGSSNAQLKKLKDEEGDSAFTPFESTEDEGVYVAFEDDQEADTVQGSDIVTQRRRERVPAALLNARAVFE